MSNKTQLSSDERQRFQDQYAEIAVLAGGLAHEIKNPLSTIGLNVQLMAEDIQDDMPRAGRMRRRVDTIQRECQHLDDILNEFVQFARAGELELVESDLNALVQDFLEFFEAEAKDANIELSQHQDPNLPKVRVDHLLIRQVWMNLARNAIQAMPDGGVLEVLTRSEDENVLVDIIDNGRGMDERTRERMFQAFFSTKASGSGLGLPTVRKIIESHQGTITCESEVGRGTRFTISLPAVGVE
ncbi:MAG: ATP-binding protein [Planctomycetota bacterium]|nr:ATP-binding protein [Planctomycetota bacterium]